MSDIEKIRDGLYVKKSFDGYRVVYPTKNDDGTINWFNVLTGGTWWKLVKLLFVFLIIAAMIWSYARDTSTCRELISHPCNLLPNITAFCTQDYTYPMLTGNFSEVIDNDKGG